MDLLLTEKLISTKEASQLSGYSSDYLARLSKTGKIKSVRVGRNWFLDKASFEAFIDSQGDRKEAYARALARARENEYRKSQSSIRRVAKTLTTPVPLPTFAIPSSVRSSVFAFLISFLVVGGASLLPSSSLLQTKATQIADALDQVRSGFSILTEREARSFVDSKNIPTPSTNFAHQNSSEFFVLPTPDLSLIGMNASTSTEFFQTPVISHKAPQSSLALSWPTRNDVLDGYLGFVYGAGAAGNTLGSTLRDAVLQTPKVVGGAYLALGRAVIEFAHAAIRADVAFTSGVVTVAPRSAEIVFVPLGNMGASLAEGTARIPHLVRDRALAFFDTVTDIAPRVASQFVRGDYMLGEKVVALSESLSRAGVEAGDTSLALTRSTVASAQPLALVVQPVIGETLNRAGTTLAAVAATVVPAQTLSSGERVALDTYTTINTFLDSTSDALAFFFRPTTAFAPTIVITHPQTATTTRTVAVSTYPTYKTVIQGVSADFVSQSLARMRSDILSEVSAQLAPVTNQVNTNITTIQTIDRIEDITGLIVRSGDFRGGKLVDATNVTTDRFAVTGSEATSTFAGAVDASGGFYVNGVEVTAGGGGGTWGSITGTLSNQTDLKNALDAKLSFANWYATTTDGLAEGLSNFYYTDTRVNTFVAASSTIPKTFVSNIFTGLQQFANASSSKLSVYGPAYFGGTATSTFGTDGSLTTPSLTLSGITGSTQCLHVDSNGVVSGTGSDCGNGGGGSVTSVKQTYGATQTGAITLATSSALTFSGLTFGQTITNAGSTFTFAPTLSGVLDTTAGGTGLSAVSDGQILYGSGSSALNTLATSTGGFLTNSYATGRPIWNATSTLNIALSDTTGTLAISRGGTNATSFSTGQPLYYDGTSLVSTSTLAVSVGGTGTTTAPSSQLLYGGGSGAYQSIATTSLTLGSEFSYSGTLGSLVGGASGSLTLATNGVALTKLAQIAANSILANVTGATGNVTALATSSLGIALSDTTGTLAISRGGTNATSQTTNGVNYYNGTSITSGSQFVFDGTKVGIGTSTPYFNLTISSSTGPQLALTDGSASANPWTFTSINGAFYLATSSPTTFATSTAAALAIDKNGTLTFARALGIASGGTATTTFYNGGITFYNSTLGTLSQSASTSNFFWDETNKRLGIGTSSPLALLSVHANAIGTAPQFVVGSSTATNFIVSNAGNAGVGTTSPAATFAINPVGGSALNQFIIGSTTGTNFVVKNSGFVGIATTSPWALASVNASATGTAPQFVVGSSTATNFIVSNGGNVGVGTTSPWGLASVNANLSPSFTAPQFVVGASVSTLFIVSNGGNVGVGTTSPAATFAINPVGGPPGSPLNQFIIGSTTGTSFVVNNSGFVGIATTSPWALSSVNASAPGTAPQFVVGSSTATNFIVSNGGNVGVGTTSPLALFSVNPNAIGTAPQFVVGSSTGTSFIVSNGGNVGVGTTSPAAVLSVGAPSAYGSPNFAGILGTLFAVGSSTLSSFNVTASMSGSGAAIPLVGIGTTSPWGMLSINPTNLTATGANNPEFVVGSSTATHFVIANNGNVGIGTSTPAYKLAVVGNYGDTVAFAGNTGEVGAPRTERTLPATLTGHVSVASNGYVYAIGGSPDGATALSTAYYANVQSDGKIGTWNTTTSLPNALIAPGAVVANGYLYVMGGENPVSTQYSTVYYAKINPDGTLGAWKLTSLMPGTRSDINPVYANGYIYVVGGYTASIPHAHAETYYARVNADGTLGTWQTGTSLGTAKYQVLEAVSGGYLYVFGGYDGSTVYATVQSAKINADGSIGSWATQTSLPGNRVFASLVTSNGYVYVIGGSATGSFTNGVSTILAARFSANGNLYQDTLIGGAWKTLYSPIGATGRTAHSSVVVNGTLYVLGGFAGSSVDGAVTSLSFARTYFGTNIDLIGLASSTLGDPNDSDSRGSVGGSIYAGSIFSNGRLNVTGNTTLSNGLSVNGSFTLAATSSSAQDYSIFALLNATSSSPLLTTLYNGNVGVGTTSPFAKLAIHANSTDTLTTLFAIGSSTNSATTTLFSVDNAGNVTTTGALTLGSALTIANGGTGTTTAPSSQLLYGGGSGAYQSIATTSLTLGSEFSYSGTLGSLVGGASGSLTLATNGVALTKLAQIAANSILANVTGATGNVTALATSSLGIALSDTTGTLAISRGGTNATSFSTGQPLYYDGTSLVSTSTLAVSVGGTGTTTAPAGQLLYGGGNGAYQSVATSSASCSGSAACSGFTVVGTVSPTITVANTIANGLTATTTFYNNGVVFYDPTLGTLSQASDGKGLTFLNDRRNLLGIGTSTPRWSLTIASSTGPQLALTGTGANIWTFREINGYLYIATSSPTTFATSTSPALTIDRNSVVTVPQLTISGLTGTKCLKETDGVVSAAASDCGSGGSSQWTTTGSDIYYTTGNVGIGTTTPLAALDIAGANNGTIPLFQLSSVASFATTTRFIVTNAGNVGIGTTTPPGKLAIQTSTDATQVFTVSNSIGSSTLQADTLDSNGAIFSVASSTNTEYLEVAAGGNVGVSSTTPWGLLSVNSSGLSNSVPAFVVGPTTRTDLLVTAGGNVGIGTSTPNWQLQVAGVTPSIAISDTNASADQKTWLISSNAGNFSIGTSTDVYAGSVPPAITIIGGSTAATSGNFGIGTSSPAAALSVGNTAGLVKPAFLIGSSTGTNLIVTNFGKVGVGTSTPYGLFSVNAGIGGTTLPHFVVGSSTATNLIVANSGFVGVATTSPWRTFSVVGTVSFNGLTSSGTGNAVCINANKDITDAGGGTCTPSSIRFKENVVTLPVGEALSTLDALRVVSFDYKPGVYSSEESPSSYGLIAEEVAKVDTKLVDYGYDGLPLTLHFERLTGLTIQAVQELDARTKFIQSVASTTALTVAANGDITAASISGPLEKFVTGSTTLTATIPSEVLSADGKSVNLYTLATFNLANIQALSSRIQTLALRVDSIESRLAALEAGTATSSPFSTTTLMSAFANLGVLIEKGIAHFGTVVASQFVASTDASGTSSAGSGTILAGNTVVEIANPLVKATSKVFVTFTTPVSGSWYLSEKAEGKFRVALSAAQATDVSFDYFIVGTEGASDSSATTTPSVPPVVTTPPPAAGGGSPTPPIDEASSTPPIATSTPPIATTTPSVSDTQPPTVTLIGDAAIQLAVGDTWADPGASALDDTDGDLTNHINVSGTVDSATPGMYTLTYSVTDAAGNNAQVSRVVSVVAPEPVPPPTPPTDSTGGNDTP